TVREPDGLAMSSRNALLSPADRKRALGIVTGLRAAWRAFDAGERDADMLRKVLREPIEQAFDAIDYAEAADPETLVPAARGSRKGDRALFAVAARLGAVRLIDNVVAGEEPMP